MMGYDPDTSVTLDELRPGLMGRITGGPTLNAKQKALIAAYEALTDFQKTVVEDTIRKGKRLTGRDVNDARMVKGEFDDELQYASLDETGFEMDEDLV